MPSSEDLSALIEQIYDAAIDPAAWRGALAGATRFVGGCGSGIYVKDAASRSGDLYYHDGGIDEAYTSLYFREYVRIDPTTTRHFFTDIGEMTSTVDMIPYEEFVQSRFYLEWARPQHLVDHLSAVIDKSATAVSLFGVFRHERDGLVDDEARSRMRLITPHVRRAVLIGNLLEETAARANWLADALDSVSAGMYLIDATGTIAHANAAGLRLLDGPGPLRVAAGRISSVDLSLEQPLRDIILASQNGDEQLGGRGIALPAMTADGARYLIHALPLTMGQRRQAGASYAAVAALFVQRAELGTPAAPELLAKAYALTPSELRVLLAIVEIGGAPEVAEALGVAETTVKFHLKRLFEKTGTHRQADLVKLVAGYANAMVA